MPRPYPREFRDDVVAVARRREGGVTLAQIAKGSVLGKAKRGKKTKPGAPA